MGRSGSKRRAGSRRGAAAGGGGGSGGGSGRNRTQAAPPPPAHREEPPPDLKPTDQAKDELPPIHEAPPQVGDDHAHVVVGEEGATKNESDECKKSESEGTREHGEEENEPTAEGEQATLASVSREETGGGGEVEELPTPDLPLPSAPLEQEQKGAENGLSEEQLGHSPRPTLQAASPADSSPDAIDGDGNGEVENGTSIPVHQESPDGELEGSSGEPTAEQAPIESEANAVPTTTIAPQLPADDQQHDHTPASHDGAVQTETDEPTMDDTRCSGEACAEGTDSHTTVETRGIYDELPAPGEDSVQAGATTAGFESNLIPETGATEDVSPVTLQEAEPRIAFKPDEEEDGEAVSSVEPVRVSAISIEEPEELNNGAHVTHADEKAAPASAEQSDPQSKPEKSKEELVESLLQVMENIVVARSRNTEGGRSRRQHHGGPLPPLPSPRSAAEASDEATVNPDDAIDNTVTPQAEHQSPISIEQAPIAERLASALTGEESATNEDPSRKRAAVLLSRRPRGPLPPVPTREGSPKPLPPSPATPEAATASPVVPVEQSASPTEENSALPRNYKEDGSVRTFVDTVDKSLLQEISVTEQKRQNVILEMITTEKQYVNDLRTLIEVYINPIQEKKLLDKKQMTTIFANVDTIYDINSRILKELEERQSRETIIRRIGDLFVREADKFKVYAAYCSSQDPRTKKVKKYQFRSPEFKAFCEHAFMLPRCRLLELDSFLIAPLQRVCKYPLLLKEALKNTPEEHEDHNDLKTALAKVSEVVDRINERTRVVKHIMDLKAIQKKVLSSQGQPVSLVERERHPIREGPLTGLRYQSHKKEKDCKGAAYYAFLLNDLLLICQPVKEGKDSRREKGGSHGSSSHNPQQQMYIIKEWIDTENVAARRVQKADENSPISSPSTSHRKQAKDKLTSLFGGGGSSSSSSSPLSYSVSGESAPVSALSPHGPAVPNQFEIILSQKNHAKIYRFQTPTKIDADFWLRDIELTRTARLQVLERQRQRDEEELNAMNAAASASPTRGAASRVNSAGSAEGHQVSLQRSLSNVFQRSASTSHVPTRARDDEEAGDADDSRDEHSSAEDSPDGPSSPLAQGTTPRAFFQKHRRKRSVANDVFVSSPVTPVAPSTTSTGQAALSTVTAALAASQTEVKELKLKLQEAERKLRVAELRINDLSFDNTELRKRLSSYERQHGSSGNLSLSSPPESRETSPRDSNGLNHSGSAATSSHASSSGKGVKRFIPGRRGGS